MDKNLSMLASLKITISNLHSQNGVMALGQVWPVPLDLSVLLISGSSCKHLPPHHEIPLTCSRSI